MGKLVDENPDALVGTLTSMVACAKCQVAMLVSWRAEEDCAGAVKAMLHEFREYHRPHDELYEIPALGTHKARDAMPRGTTVVNRVTAAIETDEHGQPCMKIGSYGPPTYYRPA